VSQLVRILLPFTECKVPGGRKGATLKATHGVLNGCVKQILQKRLEALQAFRAAMNGGREAQAILGLTGRPFQDALAINRGLENSSLAPVLERNGRAFLSALTTPPLSPAAKRRLLRDVYFICPLLGVLRPDDLVPDYRCPAGANLPRIGSLHRFWKVPVTATLNRLLKGAEVFSFLPARLSALWQPDGREAGITIIKFSKMSDDRCLGETAAVPRLSGEALKFILDEEVGSSNDMIRFESTHGHAYSAIHSDDRGRARCLNFVCDPSRSRSPASG
jgi:cytoplasmic iron level regulating protein YaaA (DUF328/UPF0246 family)